MTRKTLATCAILMLAIIGTGASAATTNYYLTDNYGGSWVDAEKSPTNTEDDDLCWAAAASNVLDWTGWGHVGGLTNTDNIFAYYQNHWTDAGSLPEYAWQWFFKGTNTMQGVADWAQVDVAGGGFYNSTKFATSFHENWTTQLAMSSVDSYLRAGYGTTLAVYSPTVAHAITVWGFSYDPSVSNIYTGIYITDSDDDKGMASPPDQLKYYSVRYDSDKWYLNSYYGYNNIYIGGVQALGNGPSQVPEPATLLGFGLPMLMIGIGKLRRIRK